MAKELTGPEKQQVKLAKDTLKAGTATTGGMTKARAISVLRRVAEWSDSRIITFLKKLDYTNAEILNLVGEGAEVAEMSKKLTPEQLDELTEILDTVDEALTLEEAVYTSSGESMYSPGADDYTSIYFYLDLFEEDIPDEVSLSPKWDGSEAAEKIAYRNLQQMFTKVDSVRQLDNEGHGITGLSLKMSIQVSDIPALRNIIQREDTTDGEGILMIDVKDPGTEGDLVFWASAFEVVDNPGTSSGVPYEDWDEYLADKGL